MIDYRIDELTGMQIDRLIEVLASAKDTQQLHKVVSKYPYNGQSPSVMLLLYDILYDKPDDSLAYGIRGFESLGREPKNIAQLKNPDRLVEYAVETADSLDELVELQNVLLSERDSFSTPKKHLGQSLLLVAREIANRQRNINFDDKSVANWGGKIEELFKQFKIRLDAHIAIVLAHYTLTGISADALEALAAYETLAKTYQDDKLPFDLMRAYFKLKYGVDKPAKGDAPEDFKADYDWQQKLPFGTMSWDQWFRHQYFGTKKPEWEKRERRESVREEIRSLLDVLEDPWSLYVKELKLLGIKKDMSYEEARLVFRRGVVARRSTFIRMDRGTNEYNDAMKETAKFLEAWRKVSILYKDTPINT